MRTVVTGAAGMLAHALLGLLEPGDTLALSRRECDVTDARAVASTIGGFGPELVLHLAAYTHVDQAESEPERARAVNVGGAENVARAVRDAGGLMVYVSTDYVFDGTAGRPYREEDATGPLSVYARTKLEGERRSAAVAPRCLVVRTGWLFGPGGRNFVDTVAGKLRAKETLEVVHDQVGRPTLTTDLAPAILQLVDRAPEGGTYHLTNAGKEGTWFDVARQVAICVGADAQRVMPSTSADQARPARRPSYSVLDVGKAGALGVGPLRDWREAVADHLRVAAPPAVGGRE